MALAALSGWAAWLWFHPPGLVEQANQLLGRTLASDSRAVFRAGYEHDQTVGELTEDKVREVFERLVTPRLSVWQPAGDPILQLQGRGAQAVATQRMSDGAGHTGEFSVILEATPNGGRAGTLQPLFQAWVLDWQHQGNSLSGGGSFRGLLEGLRKDRATLESLGIFGTVGEKLGGKFATWDQCEEFWRDALAH